MRKLFYLFFSFFSVVTFAQKEGMLYTNCLEVYDKGDTTICIEQLDDNRQLVRYYLGGKNLFSKKYTIEKNGNYAFQAVKNDFDSPKDGLGYYYYQNSQLQQILEYKNDLLYNCTAFYDKNGNKLPLGTLQNGNGTYIVYDENGLKKSKKYYKNGKANWLKSLFSK